MSTASRHAVAREMSFVHRVRNRLVQVTAAGALLGCLYGGFTLAPAVGSLATAHVAPAAQSVAAVQPESGCGAVPFGC